jgi:septum formation protein
MDTNSSSRIHTSWSGNNNQSANIVLASQSPRRVELLSYLGLTFETIPSHIDESTDLTDPGEVVVSLAEAKARAVCDNIKGRADFGAKRTLVLGADTIVVIGQDIIGKPSSREDAYQMLMRMSGRPHRVFTGVAIVDLHSGETWKNYESSTVYFRYLDSAEVRCYVKTSEPMDKAGSYALQGIASAFVQRVDGCYTNIIGLPVPLTLKMFREAGLTVLGMP